MELLYKTKRNKNGDMFAVYKCNCGETLEARVANVNNGNTKRCKQCRYKITAKKNIKNGKKDFFKQSNIVHGEKYNYSKVNYINSKTKVEIICSEHGSFYQSPDMHKRGQGCPKCKNSNLSGNFNDSIWVENGLKSKYFAGYKLYIIEVFDENEKFVKIGKTFMNIENRFKFSKMPYNYNVIFTIEDNGKNISKLERKLHKKFKKLKYNPIKKFSGSYECYDYGIIDTIQEKLKEIDWN